SRLQTLHNGLIRCAGYRGHFGNVTVARYFVEEIRISERPPGIDSNAPARSPRRSLTHACTIRMLAVSTKAGQRLRLIACRVWQCAKSHNVIDAASNTMSITRSERSNTALDRD